MTPVVLHSNPRHQHTISLPTTSSQISIIFTAIYIFFFAASWGPVVWVVTSEIYPLKVRAKSMSVSTASNWLLNFGIAYGTPASTALSLRIVCTILSWHRLPRGIRL